MTGQNYVKFLGTAGARYLVSRQLRYSAGTYLCTGGRDIMIDPGPGTLLRCARARPKIDASELDAVILSHAHIDHSNDVNILLGAMATPDLEGGDLFCSVECIEGDEAVILGYAQQPPRHIIRLQPQSTYRTGEVIFHTSPRHVHGMETYGFTFDLNNTKLSFVTDTDYSPQLADSYTDADVLVLKVVRHQPVKNGNVQHLCVDDARKLISDLKPELAILTHFGMTMLQAGPRHVARNISEELAIPVEAASDGRQINF